MSLTLRVVLKAFAGSLVAAALSIPGCLPSFEVDAEAADAGGPDADSGKTDVAVGDASDASEDASEDATDAGQDASDASDAQADGDSEAASPLCPDGPYGAAKLYFGALVEEPTFELDSPPPSDPGETQQAGEGYLSPDGLRFIQSRGTVTNTQGCSGTCFKSREYVRLDWTDPWSNATQFSFIQSFWNYLPHMFLQNLGLFSCHGGGLHCVFYARSGTGQSWPFGYGGTSDHFEYYKTPPFDGSAYNYAFAPTPDGRYLAFSSNRDGPTNANGSDTSAAALDLWTAESVDTTAPIDPTQSFQSLKKHPLASSGDFADVPEWLADDALTLVFSSRRVGDGSVELFVTERASTSDAFGAAQKIASLSSPSIDENAFSVPSLATLATHGNHGVGFLRRAVTPQSVKYYRFDVCVGSASP